MRNSIVKKTEKIRSLYLRLFLFFAMPCFAFTYDLDGITIKKTYKEDGIEVTAAEGSASSNVYYRLYNPFYKTYSDGKLKRKGLYLPYGTEICLWARDGSGKKSPVTHFIARKLSEKTAMRVISPAEGVWNKKQKLIIEAEQDIQILYSADGSDPAKFGLIYTEPVLLDKEGRVKLRIKAVGENGLIAEKNIEYSVSASGKQSPAAAVSSEEADGKRPEYTILNWYFTEFDFDKPVYYALSTPADKVPSKSELSNTYDGPIFTNREDDAVLYWTCEAAGDGIHKIDLPKKPSFTGAPEGDVNRSVELRFSDERYGYSCEAAGLNLVDGLFKTANGAFVFDCPPKTEKIFDLKISARYGGIVHGTFYTEFKIDKIPPEKPAAVFTPAFSQANRPVKILTEARKDGETLVVDITPPLYVNDTREIILTGSDDGRVAYSVNLYIVDAAGNKSPTVKKELTVDRNAVYVDSTAGYKNADGNPSNPFPSIYEAVLYINRNSSPNTAVPDFRNDRWKIYVSGDCILNEAVLIRRNIKITALDKRSEIRFSKNSGFIVNNSYFEIENCEIVRKEDPEEPREVPVIYGTDSAIKLSNMRVHTIEGGGVLNIFNSHLEAADSEIVSEQTGSCVIFNLNNSSAVLHNLTLTGTGFSAAAVSAAGSKVEADGITCSLTPVFAARTVEAWNSEITLGRLNTIRLPENKKNGDTAVWFNKKSKAVFSVQPVTRGYFKVSEQGR